MTDISMPIRREEAGVTDPLLARFLEVRARSEALAEGLSEEDQVVQSMEDASPTKWHLAHTTWFFEEFVLAPHAPDYRCFDPDFTYLFNSYYEAVGPRHARPRRGMLTRPALATVQDYRRSVTAAVAELLESLDGAVPAALTEIVTLGCHHEEQHQELVLTDILHAFSCNPVLPAYSATPPQPAESGGPLRWLSFPGGIYGIGHDGTGFAFDHEGPAHDVLLQPFRLASRPVSNAEWLEFMADGGYRQPGLWLSDGWAAVQREDWQAPLYWQRRDDEWVTMTLAGPQPVNPAAPVCHVSYYEADAFARWAGRRLPTEAEWEVAAAGVPVGGNLLGRRARPEPVPPPGEAHDEEHLEQLYGDVWEWTASPFAPYPRYRPPAGAVGEYNGKFMCGQYVLRGGSCATPDGHVRASYRNFFYPHQRWQFAGLRLADDS